MNAFILACVALATAIVAAAFVYDASSARHDPMVQLAKKRPDIYRDLTDRDTFFKKYPNSGYCPVGKTARGPTGAHYVYDVYQCK